MRACELHRGAHFCSWSGRLQRIARCDPFAIADARLRHAPVHAKIPQLTGSNDMLAGYWPILLFLIVAGGIGVALIAIGWIVGPRRPSAEKYSPYECGFEAFEDARMKFDVRYYLIAIVFILFDLEIAFLFPWATVFSDIGIVALVEMFTFLLLLVVGYVYVWKKGALEWD
jgi:NADH-quinone oxidoreductase subunit A